MHNSSSRNETLYLMCLIFMFLDQLMSIFFETCHLPNVMSSEVLLEWQPRALWLDERGTNIRPYGHFQFSLPYTDMDFCRAPSAAFGPWGPSKGVQKCARLDERGTI